MITVRRSKRTLMLGWSSFAAFFYVPFNVGFSDVPYTKRTHSQAKKLSGVHKVIHDVKETWLAPLNGPEVTFQQTEQVCLNTTRCTSNTQLARQTPRQIQNRPPKRQLQVG